MTCDCHGFPANLAVRRLPRLDPPPANMRSSRRAAHFAARKELTRGLIYTSLTRARIRVEVWFSRIVVAGSPESFNHIVRSAEHLAKFEAYIRNNADHLTSPPK